jgi:mannitol-1-/sugar-/sorbitol-6-phosphatase
MVETVWRRVAEEFGADVEAVLRVCHGRRDADLVPEFFPAGQAEAVYARIAELEAADHHEVPAMAGAADLLAAWAPRPWAAVTSGGHDVMAGRLKAAGLPVPAVLVGADDVRAGKPDPEGFRAAASALGVPVDRCLVVEDAPPGVAAGKAAGATVVAVTTTHARAALAGADAVVPGLPAVAALLRL